MSPRVSALPPFAAFVLSLTFCAAASAQLPRGSGSYADGELLVKFAPTSTRADVAEMSRELGVRGVARARSIGVEHWVIVVLRAARGGRALRPEDGVAAVGVTGRGHSPEVPCVPG
jgi:hypothetical protein